MLLTSLEAIVQGGQPDVRKINRDKVEIQGILKSG